MTMPEYIILKRKTVGRAIALTVFLIVAAVAAFMAWPTKKAKPAGMVETLSRNMLTDGGREVAYFSGMGNDSVLLGLTTERDSVTLAQAVWLSRTELDSVLAKTARALNTRIKALDDARKEMSYYKSVHNVQDEGYDMVAAHADELKAQGDCAQRLLETIASLAGKGTAGVTHVKIRTREDMIGASDVAVECFGGRWAYGRWTTARRDGKAITTDANGRTACVTISNDTIVSGRRTDSLGTYQGEMNRWAMAAGHGRYYAADGTFYEGRWQDDKREGFGFSVNSDKLRAGEWKADKYRGERMSYTSERIYGIDISKYQHGKGRKYYPIQWAKLRISNLGAISRKTVTGNVDYPVSFVYIKSTEGTTVRNKYFAADYRQARKHGFRTGAYHFFSVRSSATAQANFFLRHTSFKRGDMPPVLDVEPTDAQIKSMGGATVLFSHIRTWMSIVKRRTGSRPVIYVSQRFVNKYLSQAPDIKRDYNVWIARYGEYRPDVKLVYWQLCPDGRVSGIRGEVDINVFNGYRDKFNDFVSTETVR